MIRSSLLGLVLAATTVPFIAAAGQTVAPPVYEQSLTPQDVRAVQDRLRLLGFYAGAIDGVWGPDTSVALQRFQENRGLQVTSDLNPVTVTSLGLDIGQLLAEANASLQPAPVAQPLTPGVVRTIQARLRRLGYYHGYRDGVWGPSTGIALEQFQRNRGIQVTGEPTPTTLSALGMDPNDLAAEGSSR